MKVLNQMSHSAAPQTSWRKRKKPPELIGFGGLAVTS